MALNLEKQLLFVWLTLLLCGTCLLLTSTVNVGVHVLCVPLLMMTFFLIGTATPALKLPDAVTVPYLPLNITTVAAILYSSLYVLMEPVAGSAFGVLIFAWTAFSNHLTAAYDSTLIQWSIAVNIVCWIAQFIGHGVFEGRAPALLDNLVQALVLAPFFVWFEVLFKLGYRPELKRRLDQAVRKELAKLEESKGGSAKAANGHTNGSIKKNS